MADIVLSNVTAVVVNGVAYTPDADSLTLEQQTRFVGKLTPQDDIYAQEVYVRWTVSGSPHSAVLSDVLFRE